MSDAEEVDTLYALARALKRRLEVAREKTQQERLAGDYVRAAREAERVCWALEDAIKDLTQTEGAADEH